jgi:hypothetical protein
MQKYIAQRSFIMTDELKSYKECWEMNEAEETFLDGYTTILMATQVCEAE